ncbi:MAG: hypothetical protein IKU65_06910 [Oscillospiraceae bacterium]|nr:hypothetical protein [Oscillospiraceae bacterium]
MVKGISKRVIVVKTPVDSIFDEAIFILNENSASAIDSEKIIREACLIADDYVKKNCSDSCGFPKQKFLVAAGSLLAFTVLSFLLFFILH